MNRPPVSSLDAPIPAWVDGRLVPVGKLEAHRRGLRHKAVSVFVTRGAEILIQRRAAGKYHTPLLWANTCCTHPHMDEPPLACARRRLAEELGITGLEPVHVGKVEYRADVGGGLIEHEVVDVFRAEAAAELRIDPNPEEVAAVRWIAIDELVGEVHAHPEDFTPWIRIYLDRHMARLLPDLAAAARS